MKRQFINYPINKKMSLTLLGLVVFPVLALGCLLIIWLYGNTTRQLRTESFQNLTKGLEAVSEFRSEAEELSLECVGNGSLQRIATDRVIGRDYLELRDWLDGVYESAGVYDNICITLKNGKQYQAGNYIIEDMESVQEQLGDQLYCWQMEGSPEYYFVSEEDRPEKVWVFYSVIESYDLDPEEPYVGVLSIRIREDVLYELYAAAFDARYEELLLIFGEGEIISSSDKDSLGQTYTPELSDGKQRGSFWEKGRIYFYEYDENRQLLLMAGIPLLLFYGDVLLMICVVVVALVLCMVFAMIFGRLQKIYIIRPINDMVNAMNEVEGDRFVQIRRENRSDEVGALQNAFNEMNARMDYLINRIYRVDYEKKEAQLKALAEQLNPHFLYNTLDSIRWKALRNKDGEVAEQIVILSDFYRYILNNGNEFLTIREELSFLKKYLYLMGMRFGDRVQWEIEADDALMDVTIPKLILQPLVENAVVHGLEPGEEGGLVSIVMKNREDGIFIEVRDTGVGFARDLVCSGEEVMELENAFALKNIYNRLKLYYGARARFRIESRKNEGCRVEIVIMREETDEITDRG